MTFTCEETLRSRSTSGVSSPIFGCDSQPCPRASFGSFSSTDQMSSAKAEETSLTLSARETETLVLEAPKQSGKGLFSKDDDYSVTSEISKMVTALALANQYSYRVQYSQSIETSSYASMLAPVIRDCVLQNWNNQAGATECEADKSLYGGIGIITAGAIGMGMGIWTYASEAGKNATDGVIKTATREGADALGGATGGAAGAATRAASAATTTTSSNLEEGATFGSKVLKAGQVVGKMMGGMQGALMFGEGGIKLGVDQKYDYKKADKQRKVGTYDAAEKETSAYQGGANSSGNRMNEASGQTQRSHDGAIDLLKRASETISNAVNAAQRA